MPAATRTTRCSVSCADARSSKHWLTVTTRRTSGAPWWTPFSVRLASGDAVSEGQPIGVETDAVSHVQHRTVRVLGGAQVLSGIGVGAGIAAGSLLVADLTGSESLAGLAQ